MQITGLPPIRNSSHAVRLVVAGAVAFVTIIALLYFALVIVSHLSGEPGIDAEVAGEVSREDKYRILTNLSGTSSLAKDEKKEMLEEMRTDEIPTYEAKLEILGKLKAE